MMGDRIFNPLNIPKFQENSLSRIEPINGYTADEDSRDHLTSWPSTGGGGGNTGSGGGGHNQTCCLVDSARRCTMPAGNASYSKRIQKTVAQKKLKLHMDSNARHIYICDVHKSLIQSLRTKRKRKESDDDSAETDSEYPDVDLYQLQMNTLRRYKKHYKVPVRQGMNKMQLADCVFRHFKTIPVVEKEALTYFIYLIKTGSSKLDRDRRDPMDTE